MKKPLLAVALSLASILPLAAQKAGPSSSEDGPFKPTRESLQQYRCPEWFRDAKFGIWSHWGPQSVPGNGDWYARFMYVEGYPPYEYHLKTYGHPSKFGYKDIVQLWKAAKFDAAQADRLMGIYKKAGAKYFVSMGVHHDNFDLWNSKHHKWNAVNMGPHKDIVGIWAAAARKEGLRFGVSEHLERSYSWFNTNKGADTKGPFAGVPYDGNDPAYADFYFPPHKDSRVTYPVDPPDWWPREWRDRVEDLIDSYRPDLLYTDGAIPFGEVGREVVAHFYNANMRWHNGKLEAVYNIKDITEHGEYIKGAAVQDMERGVMDGINPEPWQTCTSIGDWFYRKGQKYKSSADVIRMLADVVSKNGNLLINIVQTPDGEVEPELLQTLDEIASWMAVNGEAIFGTRPWKVFGERPAGDKGGTGGAYNEGKLEYTAKDIRFTTKDGVLYAICLGVPEEDLRISSLGGGQETVARIELLGSDESIKWKQEPDALVISKPKLDAKQPACVFRITLSKPTRTQ